MMRYVNVTAAPEILFDFCQNNGWTSAEDVDQFMKRGEVESFFEGDPDYVKIRGITYYWDAHTFPGSCLIYCDEEDEQEVIESIEIFRELWYNEPIDSALDWEALKNNANEASYVAYRGGRGYRYCIYNVQKLKELKRNRQQKK